ncbi:Outer membrane protein Iml2/Tetratricopeptide repeat protein 39 [Trinorchestia longiramus]|nr:Outer membrane protein Iml2/Tetratricopeptide repeat protein 39 [Trinorchestia longiramus]
MATENCMKLEQKLSDAALEPSNLSSEEYAKLACHGIDLMLNNDFAAAEKLFCQHKDRSCHMAVGYCYLTFMNAVMSFEEEQIQHCRECLRETEKKYRHLNSSATTPNSASPLGPEASWYSSVKNLLSGSYDKHNEDPVWQLERHVVLADCQVLMALLNFLQQELGSVMRGGWVLRRAWKMYDSTYRRLVAMYNAAVAAATSPQATHATSAPQSPYPSYPSSEPTYNASPDSYPTPDLPFDFPNAADAIQDTSALYSRDSKSSNTEPPLLPSVDQQSFSKLTQSAPVENSPSIKEKQSNSFQDTDESNSHDGASSVAQILTDSCVTFTINNTCDGDVAGDTSSSVDATPITELNNREAGVRQSRPSTLSYFSSALLPDTLKSPLSKSAPSPTNKSLGNSPQSLNAGVKSATQPSTPSCSALSPSPVSSVKQLGAFDRLKSRSFKMNVSQSVPNIKGFFSHKAPSSRLYNTSSSANQNYRPSCGTTSGGPSPPLLQRVLGAASFGYGGLQLLSSLLPTSLLKLVQVLGGLPGDRSTALHALMRTRTSHDMRAPLATLSLLWYHTIVRPFLGMEGGASCGEGGGRRRSGGGGAAVEAARLLLQEMQPLYPRSALFLFFNARVHRLKPPHLRLISVVLLLRHSSHRPPYPGTDARSYGTTTNSA